MPSNNTSDAPVFRSGFLTLLGRPNVGKSTLLNQLVGEHLSITANKPQTTRNQIRGVVNGKDYQAVILDTPGVHRPQGELHRRIVGYALAGIEGADGILLADPFKGGPTSADFEVLRHLEGLESKTVLILNKVDQVTHSEIIKSLESFSKAFSFKEMIPLSALKGDNVASLHKVIPSLLPEGPRYFEEDQFTDSPEKFIIAEYVREQVMRKCHQEVPYGVAVGVDKFEESEKIIRIYATIFVEREAQKRIIIGAKGSMIKRLGTDSRERMEALLGQKVFLDLHVKVAQGWSESPARLSEMGYIEPGFE